MGLVSIDGHYRGMLNDVTQRKSRWCRIGGPLSSPDFRFTGLFLCGVFRTDTPSRAQNTQWEEILQKEEGTMGFRWTAMTSPRAGAGEFGV